MRPFGLLSPETVEEAAALLEEFGDEAVICAGGTELVLLLKFGLADPAVLVRLDRLGLDGIEQAEGLLRLGATVTHSGASGSSVVQAALPLVATALSNIANPRVRAVGTLGGNICFAEPHSDLSALFVLHEAVAVLSTGAEERRVEVGDFLTGTLSTSRRDEEVLVAVEVPHPPPRTAGGYARFVIGERPNVVVGCSLEVDPSGAISRARLVVGCAGPTPVRIPAAEDLLCGVAIDGKELDTAIPEAAATCAARCEAHDEDDLSGWYKRKLVQALSRRSVSSALERARELSVR
ncbi:MAG TPA: FAD binding domain-containing protein [Acidimicrobiales bacterium]|nr:FAD binding domain-containing protein [Acidimicrobiales bacterium]